MTSAEGSTDIRPSHRGPLSGIRVLDFTMFQHGPYGTMLLAELGAEVLKVEPPGGEFGRATGSTDGFSAFFEGNNRGKKSLTLDLKHPGAAAIVTRLVETVDVVVENYRPGVMERLGFGFESLKRVNPDLIYASASAWGPSGPWAERGGYDHVAQAMSGVMYLQGDEGHPHALFAGFADVIGGVFRALGVANAVLARERFGVTQRVDTSLLGSMIAIQSRQVVEFLRTQKQQTFERVRTATYTHYECQDGKYVAIAAITQDMWTRLCKALASDQLNADSRFFSPWDRAAHKSELVDTLSAVFSSAPRAHWLEVLGANDVPHAPVLDYAGMSIHEQVLANDYILEVDTQNLGRMRVPGPAIKMSGTAPSVTGGAPALGINTEEVLIELGYSWDEIGVLHESGVIRMV
jgi:crotonobetainyl-CoA:carnitine CoA-transferase CaiB-like acyl-CoA transferase